MQHLEKLYAKLHKVLDTTERNDYRSSSRSPRDRVPSSCQFMVSAHEQELGRLSTEWLGCAGLGASQTANDILEAQTGTLQRGFNTKTPQQLYRASQGSRLSNTARLRAPIFKVLRMKCLKRA